MLTITPVIQEKPTGCAIAAVANILDKSYQEMKACANNIGIYADDESLWSDTHNVKQMLLTFDVQVSDVEIPFKSWDELPQTALLAIKHHCSKGVNYWHWVVFKRIDGQPIVLDSASYLLSNIRRDFDAMQPKLYLEVQHE